MASVPSRVEEIFSVLRGEILRGQYRSGERLPSERDLAARFEANRGAIRETIKKLEQLGIVSVAPGGVRVLPVEEATLEVLGHLLELGEIQQPELVAQMLDVMGAMTSVSLRSAVKSASAEQIQMMVELVNQLASTVEDPDSHQQTWMAFSETMLSIHQNLVLRLVGNGLRTQFLGSLTDLGLEPEIDLTEVQRQLTDVRDAIKVQDAGAAADAVTRHFYYVKTSLLVAIANETRPRASRRAGHA